MVLRRQRVNISWLISFIFRSRCFACSRNNSKMPESCIICLQSRVNSNGGFFSLPKPERKRNLWIESANLGEYYRTPISFKKSVYICFRHFDEKYLKKTGERQGLLPGRIWMVLNIVSNAHKLKKIWIWKEFFVKNCFKS